MVRPTTRLRQLLGEERAVIAPGAYDAVTAKIIEAAGFPAVYMTGYGVSAGLIGRPDVGLVTMTEMVTRAGQLASALRVPLIADADTGYGNPINVGRTVREYERAGVAAIHIEDQVFPKKCGHMEGKQVIPKEEMAQKIRAAVDARQDSDFIIIARTDARAVAGFQDALERGHAYAEAGADVIFVEAPETMEEIETVARFFDKPLLFNWTTSGKSPTPPVPVLEKLGYKIIIFPAAALFTACKAVMELMQVIRETGSHDSYSDRMIPFADFNRFIGLPEIRELETRYKVG